MFLREAIIHTVAMSLTVKILLLTVVIAIPIVVILWGLVRIEKRRKARAEADFRDFSRTHPQPERDLRGMKRLLIPSDLDVVLTVSDNRKRPLRGLVKNISLSGVAVGMNLYRRNLQPGAELRNAEFVTPLGTFRVDEIRLIRMGCGTQRGRSAFQFIRIDAEQFEKLQRFLSYLDGYQKHVPSGN